MVEKIQWSDEFSVGVAEIDEQHKKLIGMINNLIGVAREKNLRMVSGKIIQDMAEYTVYHFSTEEKYFDQFGYADSAAHKLQHQTFVAKVLELQKQFVETPDEELLPFLYNILDYLQDWLIHHIIGSDKRFTQCFHEHGLQ